MNDELAYAKVSLQIIRHSSRSRGLAEKMRFRESRTNCHVPEMRIALILLRNVVHDNHTCVGLLFVNVLHGNIEHIVGENLELKSLEKAQ